LLLGGAGLLAGAALGARPPASAAKAKSSTAPRIAIVGAGLAGLRCAHELWTAGAAPIASTVYEANRERARPTCRRWT
jgi:monoamine oxidase